MSAFAAMLPRLGAEEQLAAVRTAALAAGAYSQADSQALLAALERQALGEDDLEAKREGAAPAKLAGMGVGAVIEPAPAAGDEPVPGFEFRKGGQS